MAKKGMALPRGVASDPEAREKLVYALAAGLNVAAAARQAGYSRVHAFRLLQKPEFAAEVEKVKAEQPVMSTKDEKIAVDTLREMAQNAERENDRISAAKALLDWSVRRKPKVTVTPVIKMEAPPADDAAEVEKWQAGG